MKSSGRLIVVIFLALVLAGGFWLYILSPKREEAKKLETQIESLRSSITQSQSELVTARAARREFPKDYSQLIELGKAVPRGDDTASLLVAVNAKADASDIVFDSLLAAEGGAAPAEASITTATVPGAEVPPTEAAAALVPIGATIGPAGLGVMPFSLKFSGKFLEVTEFLSQLDSFVSAEENLVAVDGRLITVNGFALSADPELGFPNLQANLSVTSYVTPPDQGLTLGATPTAPAAPVTPVEAPAPSAPAAPLAATSGAK